MVLDYAPGLSSTAHSRALSLHAPSAARYKKAKKAIGKYIKANRPDVKIVLAEPEAAALIASGVATDRNEDGAHWEKHQK